MSTGNTPTDTDMTDAYEPTMDLDPILTAEQVHALCTPPVQTPLLNLLVQVTTAPIAKLTFRDVRSWHLHITQLCPPHADLKTAVSQAAKLIAAQLDRVDGEVEVEVEGMAYGMPDMKVPWTEVTDDLLSRMSPMALRSAMLQACGVLNALGVRKEQQ